MEIITIKDCSVAYRNFRGIGGDYNNEGDRNFTVVVDEMTARALMNSGYNIRVQPGRREGDDDRYLLKVNVSYRFSAPNVYVVDGGDRTKLTEETVGRLDGANIDRVDFSMTPSHWKKGPREGVAAYLKTLYVYLQVDELDREWNEIHPVVDENGEEMPF